MKLFNSLCRTISLLNLEFNDCGILCTLSQNQSFGVWTWNPLQLHPGVWKPSKISCRGILKKLPFESTMCNPCLRLQYLQSTFCRANLLSLCRKWSFRPTLCRFRQTVVNSSDPSTAIVHATFCRPWQFSTLCRSTFWVGYPSGSLRFTTPLKDTDKPVHCWISLLYCFWSSLLE